MRPLSLVVAGLAGRTVVGHSQKPMVDENASWMTKHMAGKTSREALIDAVVPDG